ncbi:MAG TPA: hypothetical protein VGI10_29820 [Polyangiaceae bacterium]|jgi:hypothetical protein
MNARVVNASLLLLIAAACGGSVSRQGQGNGGAGNAGIGNAGIGNAGYGNYAGDPVVYDGIYPPATGVGGSYPIGVGGSAPYPYGGSGGDFIGSGGSYADGGFYNGGSAGTAGTCATGGDGNAFGGSGCYGVGGFNSGGSGGDIYGSGGFGEAGDAGAPQCPSVAPVTAPPYAVTINFATNSSDSHVWLRKNCYLEYTLTSCATGYRTPILVHPFCATDCDLDAGCVTCGLCPLSAESVTMGQTVSDTIDGTAATLHGSTGCSCATYSALPPGEYAVTVPVYRSASDAIALSNATNVTSFFILNSSSTWSMNVDLNTP